MVRYFRLPLADIGQIALFIGLKRLTIYFDTHHQSPFNSYYDRVQPLPADTRVCKSTRSESNLTAKST